jgi:hypothetical protein
MFIGHYAVGFAAKRGAPKMSLGTLFLGAQLLDLVWPVLLLLGIERVEIEPGNTVFTPLAFVYYPFSHSTLTAIGWATLVASVYWLVRRYTEGAIWLWVAVYSHWILDAISHRPDLPLYPGSDMLIGYGLWNSFVGTILVEAILFVIGIALYLKTTRARDKIGVYGFWSFVIVLALIYVGNALGPPPPNVRVLAIMALGQWLLVLWAYWFDGHREALQ